MKDYGIPRIIGGIANMEKDLKYWRLPGRYVIERHYSHNSRTGKRLKEITKYIAYQIASIY